MVVVFLTNWLSVCNVKCYVVRVELLCFCYGKSPLPELLSDIVQILNHSHIISLNNNCPGFIHYFQGVTCKVPLAFIMK